MILWQTPPNKEELGYCDTVFVDELGDTSVVIFSQEAKESRIATIVIRGSTDNYMDDIERAVDDGVNTFKALTKVCSNVYLSWSMGNCVNPDWLRIQIGLSLC